MPEVNLLLVNYYMETTAPGGINTVLREVGSALAGKGHQVTVLQQNPCHLPCEEQYRGFRIRRVNAPLSKFLYGFDVRLPRHLHAMYRALNPSVVHVHGWHSLFSPEVVFLIRRIDPEIPLLFSYHLDVHRERFTGRRLWDAYKVIGKRMTRALTHVVAFSEFEAATIAREFLVPRERISIIPHGVRILDTNKPHRSEGGPRLLYAGYLLKRKNVQSIIESVDVLVHRKDVRSASLTIVGTGPQHAALRRLIRKRGLEEHVTMKPFLSQTELTREMKDADIFVLLSNSEAYGIAVAEALALGTPCVVANATALHEFTKEPGCFGVNYPPDPQEVAQRIIDIYETNVQVGPFSHKICTWEAVARTYERVYCHCVRG